MRRGAFADLRQDLVYSLRTLRARAGFSATVILTLALGIGATTAVFRVIDSVLLRPLPVAEQDHLLVVWKALTDRSFERMPFRYESYEALRERLRTVTDLAAYPYHGAGRAVVHRQGGATSVQLTGVTGNWFGVLGAEASVGRLIEPADDRIGAARVIVLSSPAAARLFGDANRAVGNVLRVEEATYTVVGVTAPEFAFPRGAEAWVAAAPLYTTVPVAVSSLREADRVGWFLVARASPGNTPAQVRAELASALPTLTTESAWLGRQAIRAPALADVLVGDVRPALILLGLSVLVVFLVSGVNVVNLLLVRGLSRERELLLRSAMGASRARILRQLATETALLAAAGAALAVPVAQSALRMVLALAPADLPSVQPGIGVRGLLFTALAASVAVIVVALGSALRATQAEPMGVLRSNQLSVGSTNRSAWLRQALVVGQIAITALILGLAGLLLRSLDRMQRLDPGFTTQNVTLVEVDIPTSRYALESDHQQAMVQLSEQVAALPGVAASSALLAEPFAGTGGFDAIWYGENQSSAAATNPYSNYEGADASYFSALQLPIRRGRSILAADRAGSEPVVVVNEAFARLYWSDAEAVGRRIRLGSADSPGPWRRIVGVAADTRYRELTVARPTVYVPYGQGIPVRPRFLAVRTAVDPASIAGAIRSILAKQEPGAVVLAMEPLPRLLAAPLVRPRFQSALTVAFALLGLILSAIGAYGVVSFSVRQRTREFGIRMALGANAAHVRRLVLRQGLVLGGLGVALGLAAAWAGGRFVQSLLFGVDARDPLVLLTATAILLFSSLAAALLPARTAVRTDPLVVIRAD